MTSPMAVYLLHAFLPALPLSPEWQRALAALPGSVHLDAERFLKVEDRYARLVGRFLLLQGLERLGLSCSLLTHLHYGPYGRPELEAPVDFNISHSCDLVFCALSMSGRVGIDIEVIRPVDLADFFPTLTPTERIAIQQDDNPMLKFFRLWTMRESVLKAVGVGLSGMIASLDFESGNALANGCQWHITELSAWDGYACSLASSSLNDDIWIERVEP